MTTLTMTVPLFKMMLETLKTSTHPTRIFLECNAGSFMDVEIQRCIRELPLNISVAPVSIKQNEPEATIPNFTIHYYKSIRDEEPTRTLTLKNYNKDYLTSYFRTPWVDELFAKDSKVIYATIYLDPESRIARLVLHHDLVTLGKITQSWKLSDGKLSKQ